MKVTLNFSDNLVGDKGYYALYYAESPSGKFWGTSDAVLLKDINGLDLQGNINKTVMEFELNPSDFTAIFNTAVIVCGNPMIAMPVNLKKDIYAGAVITVEARDEMAFKPPTLFEKFILSETVFETAEDGTILNPALWKQGICRTCGEEIRREKADETDEWWGEDFVILLERHSCKSKE